MRLLLFLLLFSTTARAQHFRYFTHFTEKDGLSDNDVRCILRDRQGYLWVGTVNGLNRYDGYNFRHYFPSAHQQARTVSNEVIHDIRQDSSGYIWIATGNGLNRYDPRTETFKVWTHTGTSDGSLPNSLVTSLLVDKQNRLWLACDNRDLTVFDPKKNTFTTYPWKEFVEKVRPESTKEAYKTIHYLLPKGASGIWLITNVGHYSFNLSSKTFHYHPFPNSPLPAAGSVATAEKTYFGSWDSDLLRYEPASGKWSQIRLPLPASLVGGRRYVTDVFRYAGNYCVLGREGLFWMDTLTERVIHVKPEAQNRFTAPSGLLHGYYIEQDGTLWMGGEEGLWLYDPGAQHFNYTPLKPGDSKNFYNTFCYITDSKTDGRRYLLDFYANRLIVYEKGSFLKNVQLPGRAAVLFEDRAGALWVGGGDQIFQVNRKTLHLIPLPIPASVHDTSLHSVFYAMAQDAEGNYWLGNNKQGLLVYHPARNTWWKPGEAEGFIGNSIGTILADHERRTVWIATQDYGLYRFDETSGTFTLYRKEESNPGNSLGAYMVNTLCKDGQGHIWAGTDPGGISRFRYDAPKGQEFLTLNNEDGLPSNQVYSLITDARGDIWAGTLKGLAWVDSRTLRVRAFGKKDGMVNDFFDLPFSMGAHGEIMSGTIYGYQSFLPDSLLQEKTTHDILLTSFRVFDKNYTDSLNVNFLRAIHLSWEQNFFSFEFASTNFSRPGKVEYAYRLKGFNKDWVYLKDRHSASFTNVPPGDYMLEIKSGREGRWYEPGVRLAIHITPPFWATWWFRTLAVMLIAGAVWGIYRWRIAQVRKEEALKTEFNQRIARTEMAALRAQMNPHFVFNCLSSINRFILVNQPDEASAYLTKFSRLIRLILDNSRTETVLLSKELEALQLYVEMEQMRFSNRFEYSLKVAENVQAEHVEVPPLLIQPYVENAIWHGLMHKKTPGLLQVRVFYEEKKLCVEVEDNGVGRQKAMELKSRSATANKSLGMKVTAERLEAINQLYGTQAMVATEDLKGPDGAAVGTSVRICL